MSEDRIQRKIEHLTGIIRLARATLNDAERELANVAAAVWDALDGAPEPEWEEHINYGAERTDGSVAYEPRGRNYATHQQVARFGPWEPVGGEQP